MSVVEISDIAAPQLSSSLTGGTTITRKLKAVVDSLDDGPLTIKLHASCPKEGQTYAFRDESDTTFVCNAVTIDPKSDSGGLERGLAYDVTVTYSNSVNSEAVGEDEENPLDDPPVVRFNRNTYQKPALVDKDGVAIVNGADESFDPPVMRTFHSPVLNIVRNEASFSPSAQYQLEDVVNSDAFAGAPAGHWKMSPPIAEKFTRGSYTYWRVEYEIEYSEQPWNPTGIMAQGYRYRKSAGGPSQVYLDPATNTPPSGPLLLKLDGTESPVSPVDGTRLPYFHEFNFYQEIPFSPFGFGV